MRWPSLSLLLLLTAGGALAEGSFNRVPSRPVPEAPAEDPVESTADSVAAAEPKGQAAAKAEPDGSAGEAADRGEDSDDPNSAEPVEPARRFEKACIYGPRGLLYAPPGVECDPEERPSASPGVGRCVLGLKGEVLHAPEGVDCEGLVGAGVTPQRQRPRRIRRLRR